jgi:hypothetical protein
MAETPADRAAREAARESVRMRERAIWTDVDASAAICAGLKCRNSP